MSDSSSTTILNSFSAGLLPVPSLLVMWWFYSQLRFVGNGEWFLTLWGFFSSFFFFNSLSEFPSLPIPAGFGTHRFWSMFICLAEGRAMCSSGNPKRADCARCPESERSPVPEYLSSQNRTALLHKQGKSKRIKINLLLYLTPVPKKKKENKEPHPVVISVCKCVWKYMVCQHSLECFFALM